MHCASFDFNAANQRLEKLLSEAGRECNNRKAATPIDSEVGISLLDALTLLWILSAMKEKNPEGFAVVGHLCQIALGLLSHAPDQFLAEARTHNRKRRLPEDYGPEAPDWDLTVLPVPKVIFR